MRGVWGAGAGGIAADLEGSGRRRYYVSIPMEGLRSTARTTSRTEMRAANASLPAELICEGDLSKRDDREIKGNIKGGYENGRGYRSVAAAVIV
jgi:hypothetical protein